MKKLINVLWAIEKDLRVIATNSEIFRRCYVGYLDDPGDKGVPGHIDVLKKKSSNAFK